MKTVHSLAAITAALWFCGTAPAATRVALVSGESSAEVENVLDTATALLSKDAGLQLLERAEVGRVMREQQLALAGLVGAEQAVKAGRLLHVDLLAVLEGALTNEPNAKPAFGMVVFDARTGVRYADSALAGSNTMSTALAAATALRGALDKSRKKPSELHTVGLLLVRNADLPREFDSLCDSVGLLLERELTASPGIAVLERRRLEQVTKERAVAPTAAENQLLSSLQMIELDVGRDGEGLRGVMALAGADGRRTTGITATVPTRDAVALAHALADRLAQVLRIPPGRVVMDRAAEAKRFHRESVLRAQQHDYLAAVQAFDATYALNPEETELPEVLNLLMDGALDYLEPGEHYQGAPILPPRTNDLPACLAMGHRDADLLLDLSRATKEVTQPDDPTPELLTSYRRGQLCNLLQKLAAVTNADSAARESMAALALKERTLRMEVLEPFYRERAVDVASLTVYGGNVSGWLSYANTLLGRLDPEHASEDDILLLRRWLEVARRLNPQDGSGNYGPLITASQLFGLLGVGRSGEFAALKEFWQSLEADPDPFIQITARSGLLGAQVAKYWQGHDERLRCEREFRLDAQELLAHGQAAKPGPLRNRVWNAMTWGLRLVSNHNQGWQEYLETCRFALAQRNMPPGLFSEAVVILTNPRANRRAEALEVVEGALKLVIQNPDVYPAAYPDDDSWKEDPVRARLMADRAQYSRESFITSFQEKREELSRAIPPAEPRARGSWLLTTNLLDFTKPVDGIGWLLKPLVADGAVYVASIGIREFGLPHDTLQLVRVPLSGKTPSVTATTHVDGFPWNDVAGLDFFRSYGSRNGWSFRITNDNARLRFARAACLGGGNYWLATSLGVFVFPTNGGPVARLCATNGLPSDETHSIAFMDGKLYIGAGELERAGYLVAYDLASRESSILASSRRSEHLSPFDDQPPFCPLLLLADQSRRRLLMAAGSPVRRNPLGGIWSFAPASREFRQIAALDLRLPEGRPFYFYNWTWAAPLDDDTVVVPGAVVDIRDSQSPIPNSGGRSAGTNPPTAQESPRQGTIPPQARPPFLRLDGWLWSARPFQRSSLDGARTEALPPVRSDYAFQPVECLQLVDGGKRVLAADQFSLWLLELAPEPATAAVENPGTNAVSSKR